MFTSQTVVQMNSRRHTLGSFTDHSIGIPIPSANWGQYCFTFSISIKTKLTGYSSTRRCKRKKYFISNLIINISRELTTVFEIISLSNKYIFLIIFSHKQTNSKIFKINSKTDKVILQFHRKLFYNFSWDF